MLPLHHNRTRRAAVINEMLRSFPGFHSRLLELATLHKKAIRGIRTPNLLITSELHYHCAMTTDAMPDYHRCSSLPLLAKSDTF